MEKKISDEVIKLNIIINGNQARKDILDLEKANIKLKDKLDALNATEKSRRAEYNKANKNLADHKNAVQKLEKQFESLNQKYAKEVSKLKEIELQSGKTSKEYTKQAAIVKNLEAEGEKLWKDMDKASSAFIKLSPEVKKVSDEFVSFKSEIAKTTLEIENNNNKIQNLYSELSITDMTMGQLGRRAVQLKALLKNLAPDSSELQQTNAELNALKTRIAELGGQLTLTDLSMSDLQIRAQQLEDALKLELPDEKLQQYRTELDQVNERMAELGGTMDINTISMSQLEREIDRLKTAYSEAKPNTEDYAQYSEKIKHAELRLKELRGTLSITDMTMVQLITESKRLEDAIAEVPKGSNEYLKLETQLGKVSGRMREIDNNYNLLEMSTSQLIQRSKLLTEVLASITDPEKIEAYKKELEEITAQIESLEGDGEESGWSLGGMADGFNRYAALAASAIAGLTGVAVSIQKVIDANAELSDAQTNVQKTTGMTTREVDELTKSFGLLKTRTTRIDLLGIAEIGGRLGIAKAEIGDFVKVMDKSAVALGDSFEGGPEVVAEKLGRIKGLYEDLRNSKVETAFESVGSAINDLGADGTASEQNLAEFAQRVGALPEVLKPTIQEALGLGAAFEESGLKAELASNNYGKVISIAARDTDRFANVMGRPVKELEDLINSNPTEFFLQFAQSLQGVDATEFAKILDYLKLNDAEVKQVLGAASQNVDLFRDKIQLAGESMAEGTSLTNEYNLKVSNLAAVLERLQKKITEAFTSEAVVDFLSAVVDKFAKFVGAVEDTDGSMTAFKNTLVFLVKAIAVVTAAIITNTAWMKLVALQTRSTWEATKLYALGQKALALQQAITTVATQLWAATTLLLRGRIREATQAIRIMSTAMKTTPWGLVISLAAAVVTAYVAFSESADKATKQQQAFNDVTKQAVENIQRQKSAFEQSLKVAQDLNKSEAERKKAIEDIIALDPERLQGLNLNNIATAEGTVILDQYVKALEREGRMKALNAKADELRLELKNVELSKLKDNIKWYESMWNAMKKMGRGPGSSFSADFNTATANKNEAINEIKNTLQQITDESAQLYEQQLKEQTSIVKRFNDAFAEVNKLAASKQTDTEAYKLAATALKQITNEVTEQLAKLEEQRDKLAASNKKTTKEYQATVDEIKRLEALLKLKPVTVIGKGNGTTKDRAKTEAELRYEAMQKALKDSKALYKKQDNLERQAIDARLANMMDGFDKEEALEDENHRRKLEDLRKQLVDEGEVWKLQEKINNSKLSPMERGAYMHILSTWVDDNKQINSLIESEDSRHILATETIRTKSETKRLEDLKAGFDREAILRQIAKNEELAAYQSKETAKKYLQEKFNEEFFAEGVTEEEQQRLKKQLRKDLGQLDNMNVARQKRQDQWDQKELNRQMQFLETLLAEKERILGDGNNLVDIGLLTPDQIKAIQDEADQLKLKLSELLKAKTELQNGKGSNDVNTAMGNAFGGADVLGFTADQWGKTFDNLTSLESKLEAAKMVVGALQNIWGTFASYVDASEDASLRKYEDSSDAKKRRLKSQLDNGYINQAQYNKYVEALDTDLEKKKADIEYRQAKRQRAITAANIIMNTAQAIMGIWAQFPKIDFGATAAIMAGVVGALGAVQLATVMKTPLPAKGYEEGLYPEYVKREQDGKLFKAGYGGKTRSGLVTKPTYFLAGENNKPEMVIDNKAYRQLSPGTRDMLVRELRGIKGFEKGYYNNDVTGGRYEVPANHTPTAGGAAEALLLRAVVALENNTAVMQKLYDEGVPAYIDKDGRNLKRLQDEMDRIKTSRDKAKL